MRKQARCCQTATEGSSRVGAYLDHDVLFDSSSSRFVGDEKLVIWRNATKSARASRRDLKLTRGAEIGMERISIYCIHIRACCSMTGPFTPPPRPPLRAIASDRTLHFSSHMKGGRQHHLLDIIIRIYSCWSTLYTDMPVTAAWLPSKKYSAAAACAPSSSLA